MPVINRIADMAPQMAAWRRHLHQHPELALDCPQTAAFVAARLREFGVDEVHEGIARTGIVALIRGQGTGPVIGLRADMDALPMTEETGAPHASTVPGRMHACGHDGHTTMLLGAAQYLAETRNFAGTVALIFQPAEEAIGGARIMVEEGIIARFGIAQVYALHNAPGTAVGQFYTTPGPIMAAVDTIHIHVTGKGGHGAIPQDTRDPVVAACAIVTAIQTIVSRNHATHDDLVISITQIHTGSADNIIPETAYINGTVRTFDRAVQSMVMRRLEEVVAGTAAAYGVQAVLDYEKGYPPTVNDPACTAFAAEVAAEVGTRRGHRRAARDGFGRLRLSAGTGAGRLSVHRQRRYGGPASPAYDFTDDGAAYGASFFARLAERALPLGPA